jgi:hypothetical protein
MNLPLVEAIAKQNVHIRELLELKMVADRFNVTSTVTEMLTDWVKDWMSRNPRQAALYQERHGAL